MGQLGDRRSRDATQAGRNGCYRTIQGLGAACDSKSSGSYRELLYFLTWKNILIQYKQAVLGVAWAVLNPVLTMIVFTVIFNKLLHVGTGNYPVAYPVFVYAGLLPWNLFSGSLASAGTSLVGNSNLITKVYFPRLVIPGSAVLSQLPNFLISFAVLCVLMAAYRVVPTWQVIFLPFLTLIALLTADGRIAMAERTLCALS